MVKHNDITGRWIINVIAKIIDDEVLPILERGIHTAAINAIPSNKAVHHPKNEKRQQQCFNNLSHNNFG